MMSTAEEELLEACERGDVESVRELAKAVDPISVVEKRYRRCRGWLAKGWTPLHYASA